MGFRKFETWYTVILGWVDTTNNAHVVMAIFKDPTGPPDLVPRCPSVALLQHWQGCSSPIVGWWLLGTWFLLTFTVPSGYVKIAIENDRLWWITHWKWWFSIVMLVYQRVLCGLLCWDVITLCPSCRFVRHASAAVFNTFWHQPQRTPTKSLGKTLS